jgi:small subunit ribosomal protein S8e
MGISRDSRHKRRASGGKKANLKKKRQYEAGRPGAMTKLGNPLVKKIRVRGGNTKLRALRLEQGNFTWGTEVCTRKTRILDVVYNASNNELVRTKTLVKNAIVIIDASPFRSWYQEHYGVTVGLKKGKKVENMEEDKARSDAATKKIKTRQQGRTLDSEIDSGFASGRLLACISSRPGQSGRCDGYILEGKELEFYAKKLRQKGSKK